MLNDDDDDYGEIAHFFQNLLCDINDQRGVRWWSDVRSNMTSQLS